MSVHDVRLLPEQALPGLARRVRGQILETVSRTGGHLSSSLGAVELVIALLRAFNPQKDRILWDVGHQAYAWKILTDRGEYFGSLRQIDGISGFPNPDESAYDAFVAGHAGASLAVARGIAAARDLKGGTEHVVAVIGDAALANGMALEALEGYRGGRRMILVLNDNGSGGAQFDSDTLLRSFGFTVLPRLDGHDVSALEKSFAQAKDMDGPVAIPVSTVKGRGFAPAEADPEAWHGVGAFNISSPLPKNVGANLGWSDVFGRELVDLARSDGRICALTAAMRDGTGLSGFAREFPDRFFDVGICEESLVAFAGGLAKEGMRPVVAVYSTFLQRAIDQVMHDVCLLKLPVVFAIDRAGCVGHDGRTHHGMFDIPMLRCLPGLTIAQPSSVDDLRGMLALALESDSPWAIRYPRGGIVDLRGDSSTVQLGVARQLFGEAAHLQIWALGDQVEKARRIAELLEARGNPVGVVDARFVKPFDVHLLERQRIEGDVIVSLENGSVLGGFGEAIGADLRLGWPDEFVDHGAVEDLERRHGLDVESLASRIEEFVR